MRLLMKPRGFDNHLQVLLIVQSSFVVTDVSLFGFVVQCAAGTRLLLATSSVGFRVQLALYLRAPCHYHW